MNLFWKLRLVIGFFAVVGILHVKKNGVESLADLEWNQHGREVLAEAGKALQALAPEKSTLDLAEEAPVATTAKKTVSSKVATLMTFVSGDSTEAAAPAAPTRKLNRELMAQLTAAR